MIEDFANNKIKCFTEEVINVEKLDIEFICTDQGAHNSVEAFLSALWNTKVTSGGSAMI